MQKNTPNYTPNTHFEVLECPGGASGGQNLQGGVVGHFPPPMKFFQKFPDYVLVIRTYWGGLWEWFLTSPYYPPTLLKQINQKFSCVPKHILHPDAFHKFSCGSNHGCRDCANFRIHHSVIPIIVAALCSKRLGAEVRLFPIGAKDVCDCVSLAIWLRNLAYQASREHHSHFIIFNMIENKGMMALIL